MKQIETEIRINASVKDTWEVLTNFEDYAQWNPFIRSIVGEKKVGAVLTNTMNIEGMAPQIFKPKVLEFDEYRSFRWIGKLFFKGIFDGEHYFKLIPHEDGGTKLIHGEIFKGILLRPIWSKIGVKTEEGFEKMNLALKEKAESLKLKI